MGARTEISWCDATFNPWIGCAKVSPACDGCYAEAMMDLRYGRVEWGGPGKGVGTRSRTSAANWRQPLAWNRAAAKAGTRPFVFCASLADVFDNAVPAEWRRDLFDLIRATPHLVWLLLTKRPGNIVEMARESGGLPSNAAIGCTVVTQEEADRDVPKLLAAKAELRPAFVFLSIEPLLGPISLRWAKWHPWDRSGPINEYDGARRLDWIITGGETDQGVHKARPPHPDWFRSLRDEAVAAGAAYHHKQNGEWLSLDQLRDGPGWTFTREAEGRRYGRVTIGGFEDRHPAFDGREIETQYPWPHDPQVPCMLRVGKARAGRLLDGRTWDERPVMPALSLANAEPTP